MLNTMAKGLSSFDCHPLTVILWSEWKAQCLEVSDEKINHLEINVEKVNFVFGLLDESINTLE